MTSHPLMYSLNEPPDDWSAIVPDLIRWVREERRKAAEATTEATQSPESQ